MAQVRGSGRIPREIAKQLRKHRALDRLIRLPAAERPESHCHEAKIYAISEANARQATREFPALRGKAVGEHPESFWLADRSFATSLSAVLHEHFGRQPRFEELLRSLGDPVCGGLPKGQDWQRCSLEFAGSQTVLPKTVEGISKFSNYPSTL